MEISKDPKLTKDRFQLSWNATKIQITENQKEYNQETRLHLVHYAEGSLLCVLYLTPVAPGQEKWLVKFDPIADNICQFNSKLEITTALNCLLEASGFTDIFHDDIDIVFCRSLIKAITDNQDNKAKEMVLELCSILNISLLPFEDALHVRLPENSIRPTSMKIAFGKQELNKGLLSFFRIGGRNFEDVLLLTLDVSKTANLFEVDYNDELQLYVDIGQGPESVFDGIIDTVRYESGNEINLVCRSYASILENTKLQGFKMRMDPRAILYYLLRSSGWPEDKVHIDGVSDSKRIGLYYVFIPLANIRSEYPFSIGDVTIAQLDQEQKKILKSLDLESDPNYPVWKDDVVWAQVYTPALHIFGAQVIAMEKIDKAIDILSDVKSNSRPVYFSKAGKTPVSWNRMDRLHCVTRDPWVYIKNVVTKEYIFGNTQYLAVSNVLAVNSALISRLESETEAIQILFQRSSQKLSKRERSIISALHWLRRARDEGKGLDKLIYLWNAIEFLCAPISIPALFSKEEIDSITKLSKSSMSPHDVDNEKKFKRLSDLIANLNDPSLLYKLEYLINSDRENIEVSKEEWSLINKSRTKRNSLFHGKSAVFFSDSEATKLSFIVSKIISGLAKKL
ncbi:MAG: hypothetical protein NTZ34_12345 [Chloroflexi bacterium]|nr:hypothetical protein [Chloroflexota bacterium]